MYLTKHEAMQGTDIAGINQTMMIELPQAMR
jgi:hypothetical protein